MDIAIADREFPQQRDDSFGHTQHRRSIYRKIIPAKGARRHHAREDRHRSYIGVAGLTSIAGCSSNGEAEKQANAAASTNAQVSTGTQCADDQPSLSTCMIRIILEDIERTRGGKGGGGISDIKATSSTSYLVALPSEERTLELSYQFAVGTGTIKLVARTEKTRNS